jgi:uncharacterized protein (DUF924 family)
VNTAAEPTWVGDVLRFWFEELGAAAWFTHDASIDERIRARFLALHEGLHSRAAAGAAGDPAAARELLAAVIVLDQFSRNMFRGQPRAFASDAFARRLARRAISGGFDLELERELGEAARMFLYLPFEHSEDRDDQAFSVGLFEQLGNDEWTRYARAHKSIIDDFGRFPHRNVALGRPSTPAELERLRQPMGGF